MFKMVEYTEKMPLWWKCCFMKMRHLNEQGDKFPTFMKNIYNCLICRKFRNHAGLIKLP